MIQLIAQELCYFSCFAVKLQIIDLFHSVGHVSQLIVLFWTQCVNNWVLPYPLKMMPHEIVYCALCEPLLIQLSCFYLEGTQKTTLTLDKKLLTKQHLHIYIFLRLTFPSPHSLKLVVEMPGSTTIKPATLQPHFEI